MIVYRVTNKMNLYGRNLVAIGLIIWWKTIFFTSKETLKEKYSSFSSEKDISPSRYIILLCLTILPYMFKTKGIQIYSRGLFSRKCSTSRAAIQPDPAAVTA